MLFRIGRSHCAGAGTGRCEGAAPGARARPIQELLDPGRPGRRGDRDPGEVETGNRPADDIAAEYFRRRRYIGAKDRAQIAGHVYAVLRHRAALDWWIARAGRGAVETAARSRVLAALVLVEGWRPEAVAACCDGDRFRPASAQRRRVERWSTVWAAAPCAIRRCRARSRTMCRNGSSPISTGVRRRPRTRDGGAQRTGAARSARQPA